MATWQTGAVVTSPVNVDPALMRCSELLEEYDTNVCKAWRVQIYLGGDREGKCVRKREGESERERERERARGKSREREKEGERERERPC